VPNSADTPVSLRCPESGRDLTRAARAGRSTTDTIRADTPLYLNGRFQLQVVTGVQRYAAEITAALDRLSTGDSFPTRLVMLTPRGWDKPTPYRAIRHHAFGKLHGHLWEQLELPRRARDGLLVSLGNSGPVLHSRQLIVLHDANIYALPDTYSVPFRLWHKALHRLYRHSSARIATVSKFSAGEIARYLHLDPSQILGPTLEGADHILRVEPDFTILPRHGLVAGRYVLAVGSLARHKNLAALAATVAELDRRGFHLAIAGSADPAIFSGAGNAGPRSAKYLGRVSDAALRALYERAACLVFPSRYEGFGIPPIEAMACGCPVVAATAGAVIETCGDAALYCDPDDQTAIAATVARVIDEPSVAGSLRERGRIRAQALTWEAAARRLMSLIEQIRHHEHR
jgi:glycosyltransferase involved in cell wall biosynthesis